MELKDVVFARPVGVEGELEVHIALEAQADGAISYEIYSRRGEETLVHSQGRALRVQPTERREGGPRGAACEVHEGGDGARVYQYFEGMGLSYRPAMQALQEVRSGPEVAVAELKLPVEAAAGAERYMLHPSLMDGSLQGSIGLMRERRRGTSRRCRSRWRGWWR